MPDDLPLSAPEPPPSPELSEPPGPEITLEEWIAATQSCCGVSHDDE